MKFICIGCAFFYPFIVFAQAASGPRITALGNNGSALQDIWSLQSNQAGIAALKKTTASVSFENRYLNPELSTKAAVIAVPYKQNVFGLSFKSYGFSAYSEQKAGLSYAKSFGTNLFISLTVNYHQITIQQYGNTAAYSVETGIQYYLNDKLLIGTHIANPTRSTYTTEAGTAIPVVLQFGASYKFTDKLLLNSAFEKYLNSNTDFKTGIEYSFIDSVSFRGGISVNPFRQYTGFGIALNRLRLDLAASSHPDLGISPQIGLSYEF